MLTVEDGLNLPAAQQLQEIIQEWVYTHLLLILSYFIPLQLQAMNDYFSLAVARNVQA